MLENTPFPSVRFAERFRIEKHEPFCFPLEVSLADVCTLYESKWTVAILVCSSAMAAQRATPSKHSMGAGLIPSQSRSSAADTPCSMTGSWWIPGLILGSPHRAYQLVLSMNLTLILSSFISEDKGEGDNILYR